MINCSNLLLSAKSPVYDNQRSSQLAEKCSNTFIDFQYIVDEEHALVLSLRVTTVS